MKLKTTSLLQIVALILVISPLTLPAQVRDIVPLQSGWKFITGDNLEYAAPGFDDSRWQAIRVDESWDPQGFEKLDGFAWYRIKVVIPSSLKAAAHLKDGLRVFLGKINNFDQSFLNGRLIGMNGSAAAGNEPLDDAFTKADNNTYEKDRIYVLPVDDPPILWDKENVIAVRVFDAGGLGGMYSGDGGLRRAGSGACTAATAACAWSPSPIISPRTPPPGLSSSAAGRLPSRSWSITRRRFTL